MKTTAEPFSMHFLAQSGFVGVKTPDLARAVAHCESENQPVHVTDLLSTAAPLETSEAIIAPAKLHKHTRT
jgi:hypothetical protein